MRRDHPWENTTQPSKMMLKKFNVCFTKKSTLIELSRNKGVTFEVLSRMVRISRNVIRLRIEK